MAVVSNRTINEAFTEIPQYDGMEWPPDIWNGELDTTYTGTYEPYTFESRHIDEYVDLNDRGDIQVLTGYYISSNLSIKYTGCISAEQFYEREFKGDYTGDGFMKQIGPRYVYNYPFDGTGAWHTPTAAWYSQWHAQAGIYIGVYSRSQTYYDPDEGKTIYVSGLREYAHANGMPAADNRDPTFNIAAATNDGDDNYGGFGDVEYINPWEYSAIEKAALNTSFGFEYGVEGSDGSISSTTIAYMDRAMENLVADMMTGFVPRADISRRTPAVTLTDADFEKITGKEIIENPDIINNVGLHSDWQSMVSSVAVRDSVIARISLAMMAKTPGDDIFFIGDSSGPPAPPSSSPGSPSVPSAPGPSAPSAPSVTIGGMGGGSGPVMGGY